MTTTTPMACGNCGNGLFRISRAGDALHAECASCASVSIITTKPTALQIGWGEGAHGILCDMAPSMEQVTPTEPAPPPPCPCDTWAPAPNGQIGTVCTKCGFHCPF